jgi:hypothetical protein
VPVATPVESAESSSGVDALFGDTQFREYEQSLVPVQLPTPPRPAPRGARVTTAPAHVSTAQKVMISVLGGVVAVLALVALFFLGTKVPELIGAAPAVASSSPSASRSPSPSPTPTVAAVGPVAPGIHGWNSLLGGECLDPFTTPWAEKFTVVDCAVAHPAQMVFRGTFPPVAPASPPSAAPSADASTPPSTTTFPGAAALQAQISLLCAAPGVLDLAAAGQYSDAQVQGSYPVTAEEWDAGQRDYFCFISRSSGQPLTGSVAAAQAAP